MSLRAFHAVFISICLGLLAFLLVWGAGRNPTGHAVPWLLGCAAVGALLMLPYLRWYLKHAERLPG